MGKIFINLAVTFLFVGIGCWAINDDYVEKRETYEKKVSNAKNNGLPTDGIEKPSAAVNWITIRNVSFVLSGLILLIGCIYVQKTGEIVKYDGDWGTGIFSGEGGDGGGGGE